MVCQHGAQRTAAKLASSNCKKQGRQHDKREREEGEKRVRRLREKSGRQLLGREGRKKREGECVIGERRWAHKQVKKEKETRKQKKEDEEKEAEEGGGEQVKKDVTGWTEVTRNKWKKMVQIFVKVNGSKATPIEVNLMDDKVENVMRRIQEDEDAYVTMQGKVLRTNEKLQSCGVTDGCMIQVTSRMRGGGKHKDKKSKGEKKQVAQLDDGMCAMACEQMRWMTESVNMLQSTDEDKRRRAGSKRKSTHKAGEDEELKALKAAKTLDPSIHLGETKARMQCLKPTGGDGKDSSPNPSPRVRGG